MKADFSVYPYNQYGTINNHIVGFKELVAVLQRTGLVSKSEANSMDSIRLNKSSGAVMDLATEQYIPIVPQMILFNGDKIIKEMPLESTQILIDAVGKRFQRKTAWLILVLTFILFGIGIALVIMDCWSKK